MIDRLSDWLLRCIIRGLCWCLGLRATWSDTDTEEVLTIERRN